MIGMNSNSQRAYIPTTRDKRLVRSLDVHESHKPLRS